MDISTVSNLKVPAFAKKAMLKAGKHGPTIMVAAGACLVVAASVDACRQTLKARDILDQANSDLDDIKNAEDLNSAAYTAKDAKEDRAKVYAKTAAGMVKTYGRPVLVGATGLGLIVGAHKVMSGRNAALTVAYSNLLSAYNKYREKVVAAVGEDEEMRIRTGYSVQDIEVEDEDGTKKTVKDAKVVDPLEEHSLYARLFDDSCPNWSKNPSANLQFLRAQQNYANDQLRANGILFLNDVYKMLGLPLSQEGQIVGWVWDPGNPDIDSYVDFGIYDKLFESAAKRDFINGHEACVWLDFNVDGTVYHLL